MKALIHLASALLVLLPELAWAEDVTHGGYRGIATIYYTLIWGILV